MTEADSMTVGGRKCGAVLRQDPSRRCQRPAGWGTEPPGWARCKLHGGASPGGRKAAAREMAHAMMPTLGRDLEVEPTDALLAVVHREAGRLAWLREEIQLLGPGGDVTDKGSLFSVLAKMEAECCERLARFSAMALNAPAWRSAASGWLSVRRRRLPTRSRLRSMLTRWRRGCRTRSARSSC